MASDNSPPAPEQPQGNAAPKPAFKLPPFPIRVGGRSYATASPKKAEKVEGALFHRPEGRGKNHNAE